MGNRIGFFGLFVWAALMVSCAPKAANPNGPLSWKMISGDAHTGAIVVLAAEGAAPQLVLWCIGDGTIHARAHMFTAKDIATPDNEALGGQMALTGQKGAVAFDQLRVQGTLRTKDGILIEGQMVAGQTSLPEKFSGFNRLTINVAGANWAKADLNANANLMEFSQICAPK